MSHQHLPSPALLTDFYQLTMAYGYWKCGRANDQAVFHLYFRNNPFDSGFTLAAGLASAVDYLNQFRFSASDLAWLATLRDGSGPPMYEPAFLEFLERCAFPATWPP
jgi:nicotinate phosphoribosyltransferase